MKNVFYTLLLCAATMVIGDFVEEKKQAASSSSAGVGSSSTSSVFSIPTTSPLPTVNSSQYDLSQHFCRLWRHQSVYADGKIYIDGGNTGSHPYLCTFNSTSAGKYAQGMNDNLLVLDLSKNFTNQDTFPYSTIYKGPQVPNTLIEGALWYSRATRKVYQVGGRFSFNNVANPGYVTLANIPESSIWEFDVDKKTWAQSNFTLVNTGSKVDRPGEAANCDAPALNMSFTFEGAVQQRSDQDYVNYKDPSTLKFEEGMLQLDTTTSPPTLTNSSVPTYMGPRLNGAMVHVPVGPKGVIVHLGGQTFLNSAPFGVPIINGRSMLTAINMTFVDILDLETGYWFRQTTFGLPDIPTARSDMCAILISAQDGSSHNIFVFAGTETYNTYIAYEEMWVLTLPTFQWKKVYTRDGGRYGHTCHVVGENLIIIGGMETTSTGADVNYCSPHMPAEIFNLVSLNYTGAFDARGASRPAPVPTAVVALIGGTSSGGAVVRAPKAWSDLYLQYIFDPSLTRPAYTPTYQLANATANTGTFTNPNSTTSATPNSQSDSSAPVGAIAGGVVGGAVLLMFVAGIVGCYLRRRMITPRQVAQVSTSELPTFNDTKSHAIVEVSQYGGRDTDFTPYRPFNQTVVELQAEDYRHEATGYTQNNVNAEGHDQPRLLPTSPTSPSPVSPPLSAPPLMRNGLGDGQSPQLSIGSLQSQSTDDIPIPATPRTLIIQRKTVGSGESTSSAELSRSARVHMHNPCIL